MSEDRIELTGEQRMLLQIRDTLYEGSWEDFVTDLRRRADGRPHVFETVALSPAMKATIAQHLGLIAQMQAWEHDLGHPLQAELIPKPFALTITVFPPSIDRGPSKDH